MPGAMTPEEIRYHARRIAALRDGVDTIEGMKRPDGRRKRRPTEEGARDFNPNRRVVYRTTLKTAGDGAYGAVDQVFETRAERGWLPRGGDE